MKGGRAVACFERATEKNKLVKLSSVCFYFCLLHKECWKCFIYFFTTSPKGAWELCLPLRLLTANEWSIDTTSLSICFKIEHAFQSHLYTLRTTSGIRLRLDLIYNHIIVQFLDLFYPISLISSQISPGNILHFVQESIMVIQSLDNV